jgi:MFS family permease
VNRKAGLAGLLVGTTLSLLGSRMTMVALPWLVLVTTNSPGKTGIVGAVELLPYVLACALSGPLIDRIGGRKISILSDALSMVTVGTIPLLADTGRLGFPALLGLVAVTGLLRGLGDTAKHGAMFPQTVERAGTEMTRAASLVDGFSRGAGMVGVVLAGALITWFGGAANVLLFDALSFGLCALIIGLFVRVPGRAEHSEKEAYGQALKSGVAFIRSDALVLGLAVMVAITNTLDQASSAVLSPLWAREIYGSAVGIGIIGASFGLGAVLGNIAFTILAPKLPRWSLYTVGFLIAGGPRFAVLALGAPTWLLIVNGLIDGLAVAAINPILGSVFYERTPEKLQARVNGLVSAVAYAGMPVGALLGGWLGGFGARPALLITGAIYLAATLMPLFGKVWREMDIRPAAMDRAEPVQAAGQSTAGQSTAGQSQEEAIGATVA